MKAKKLLAILLTLVFIISLVGCNTASDDASDATPDGSSTATEDGGDAGTPTINHEFTLFMGDSAYNVPPEGAPVITQVEEATGVRIEYIVSPAEVAERLNTMLVSDDLPDLIHFYTYPTNMKQFIEADKLVPLRGLLEANAPEILDVNWIDVGPKIQDENGELWFFPPTYLFSEDNTLPEAWRQFNVRTDLFDEIGYESIPATLEEFTATLKEVQQTYPDTIPLSLALGPDGMIEDIIMVGAAVNGSAVDPIQHITEVDGEIVHITEVDAMKEWFQYLNSLNQEGLLDIESPILSFEMLKQKVVAGNVWSFIGDGWEIGSEFIAFEAANDSLRQILSIYPTVDESVEVGTYAPFTYNLFETGVTITEACEAPEEFVKFYSYLNSEEGFLDAYGVVNYDFEGENTFEETEGYDFIVQKSVEHIPGRTNITATTWMGETWASDENWWWNHGINSLWHFTYAEINHPEGQYDIVGDLDVGMWWDENTTRINEARGITGKSYFAEHRKMGIDTSSFDSLALDPGSDAHMVSLNSKEAVEKHLPRAIMAENDAEFEEHWSAMLDELESIGLDEAITAFNVAYDDRNM